MPYRDKYSKVCWSLKIFEKRLCVVSPLSAVAQQVVNTIYIFIVPMIYNYCSHDLVYMSIGLLGYKN